MYHLKQTAYNYVIKTTNKLQIWAKLWEMWAVEVRSTMMAPQESHNFMKDAEKIVKIRAANAEPVSCPELIKICIFICILHFQYNIFFTTIVILVWNAFAFNEVWYCIYSYRVSCKRWDTIPDVLYCFFNLRLLILYLFNRSLIFPLTLPNKKNYVFFRQSVLINFGLRKAKEKIFY